MNPQLKQSWLAALRSGEYKQAFGHLRITTGMGDVRHCAMGVLYDLITPKPAVIREPPFPFHFEGVSSPFMAAHELAAVGVAPAQQQLIACLNDHGKTFDEIADIIERDLESEGDLAATVNAEVRRIGETVKKNALPPVTTEAFVAAQKFFIKSPFLTSYTVSVQNERKLAHDAWTAMKSNAINLVGV
jgi:hypothetical protein